MLGREEFSMLGISGHSEVPSLVCGEDNSRCGEEVLPNETSRHKDAFSLLHSETYSLLHREEVSRHNDTLSVSHRKDVSSPMGLPRHDEMSLRHNEDFSTLGEIPRHNEAFSSLCNKEETSRRNDEFSMLHREEVCSLIDIPRHSGTTLGGEHSLGRTDTRRTPLVQVIPNDGPSEGVVDDHTHMIMWWMNLYEEIMSDWVDHKFKWINGGVYLDGLPIKSNQRMNWKKLSNVKRFTFSDQFILQFRSKLHLATLLRRNPISGSCIYNLVKSIVDPKSTFSFVNGGEIIDTICRYQLLSEDMLCNQASWWNWDIVSRYQNITEGVILRAGTNINYDLLRCNRKTSFYVKSKFIADYEYREEYSCMYLGRSIEDILEFDPEPDWALMFVLNRYTPEEIRPYADRLSYHDRKILLVRHDVDLIDEVDMLFDPEFTSEIEQLISKLVRSNS